MPTPIDNQNGGKKTYSLAKNPDVVADVMQYLSAAVSERENQVKIDNWKYAPRTIWEMGQHMYEDGNKHLPSQWRDTICPEELHIGEAPTWNLYKLFIEIIQAAILQASPSVEFQLESAEFEDTEEEKRLDTMMDSIEAQLAPMGISFPPQEPIPDAQEGMRKLIEYLNKKWDKFTEKSRLMSEYDVVIANDCNFGNGWISLNKGDDGDIYGRATHPQLIVFDPSVERKEDIQWIAKVFAVPWSRSNKKDETLSLYDSMRWPESIMKKPSEQGMRVELWIRKGTQFAGYMWEDQGIHAVISGNNTVLSEEKWDMERFPLVLFTLLPSDTIWGQAMSKMLYESQVYCDKILAFIQARISRAAGEKYHVMKDAADTIVSSRGTALTSVGAKNLEHPGVEVIYDSAKIEMMAPPVIPQDMLFAYREAVANMEKIAGLSAAYQGIPPKSVTAGTAIRELAEQSSRRVNRMATHMAEGIRDLAYTWAEYELAKIGRTVPEGMEIKVTLSVQEEENRRNQFEKIMNVAETWTEIPPELKEIVIDSIPGLTPANRKMLMGIITKQVQEMKGALQNPQGPVPGAVPPAQSPEVGDDMLPLQPLPMSTRAMPVMGKPPGGMLPPPMTGQPITGGI